MRVGLLGRLVFHCLLLRRDLLGGGVWGFFLCFFLFVSVMLLFCCFFFLSCFCGLSAFSHGLEECASFFCWTLYCFHMSTVAHLSRRLCSLAAV